MTAQETDVAPPPAEIPPHALPTLVPPPASPTLQPTVTAAGLYAGPAEEPNRYRLWEHRSAGGEGEVWRATAHHAGEEFQYAVKALRVDTSDAAALEGLRLQAALLTQLEHPALVKVHEVFVGPAPHRSDQSTGPADRFFIVMKWIRGRSLQEAHDAGALPLPALIDALTQVGNAVDYLHSGTDTGGRSVLHRDIKPANIVLTDDGRAYLVDFGLARLAGAELMSRVSGTLPLMAPESVHQGKYSPASDRYGLGATLYTLLVGEPPLPGVTDVMAERLSARLGAEHASMAPLVMEMLNVDPALRPATAREWLQRLRLPSAPPSARRGRSARWLAAALGVLTVAGLAGGYAVHRSRQPEPPAAAPSATAAAPTHVVTSKPPAPVASVTAPARTPRVTAASAAPTDEPNPAVLKRLDDMSRQDLRTVSLHGQYAARLAAKQPGITDKYQKTASGKSVFWATDILREHQRLRNDPANGGLPVVLLKSTDFGSRELYRGKPLYMTFALGDFGDKQDVLRWCADRFPDLRGAELANQCTYQRLRAGS